MKKLYLLFFLLASLHSNAQRFAWLRNSSGSSLQTNYVGTDVDSLGNIYVAANHRPGTILDGTTYNGWGGSDILLTKYDVNGNRIWTKEFGGGNFVLFNDIAVDNAGNTYLTFVMQDSLRSADTAINVAPGPVLVKVDPTGRLERVKIFTDQAMVAESDNYIYVTHRLTMEKLDTDFNTIWSKTASNNGNFTQNSFSRGDIDVRGGFIFSSFVEFDGPVQFAGLAIPFTAGAFPETAVIALDTAGNGLWTDVYTDIAGTSPNPQKVAVNSNGEFFALVNGQNYIIWDNDSILNSSGTSSTRWTALFKYNNDGTKDWKKIISYTGQGDGQGIAIDANDNMVFCGSNNQGVIQIDGQQSNSGGSLSYWAIKLNPAGTIQWMKYPSAGAQGTESSCVSSLPGDNWIMAGVKSFPATFDCFTIGDNSFGFYVTKIDPLPAAIPTASFTFTANGNTYDFVSTSVNADSVMWDFGDTTTSNLTNPSKTFANGRDYTVVLTAYYGVCTDTATVQILSVGINELPENAFQLYPNPASEKLNIVCNGITEGKIILTDLTGRVVNEKQVMNGTATIDVNQMSNGTYMLKLMTEGSSITKKVVIGK